MRIDEVQFASSLRSDFLLNYRDITEVFDDVLGGFATKDTEFDGDEEWDLKMRVPPNTICSSPWLFDKGIEGTELHSDEDGMVFVPAITDVLWKEPQDTWCNSRNCYLYRHDRLYWMLGKVLTGMRNFGDLQPVERDRDSVFLVRKPSTKERFSLLGRESGLIYSDAVEEGISFNVPKDLIRYRMRVRNLPTDRDWQLAILEWSFVIPHVPDNPVVVVHYNPPDDTESDCEKCAEEKAP